MKEVLKEKKGKSDLPSADDGSDEIRMISYGCWVL